MTQPNDPHREAAPPKGFLKRFGPLLLHWATFLVVLGTLVGIHHWNPMLVNHHFSAITAKMLAVSMNVLGKNASASGLIISCDICSFRIIGECTAFYPMAIYISAVLAFPSPIVRRLLGVLLGIPLLLLINQVRLVSLCYIVRSYPEYFETIHIVVWQTVIIFLTLLVWVIWAATLAHRK